MNQLEVFAKYILPYIVLFCIEVLAGILYLENQTDQNFYLFLIIAVLGFLQFLLLVNMMVNDVKNLKKGKK